MKMNFYNYLRSKSNAQHDKPYSTSSSRKSPNIVFIEFAIILLSYNKEMMDEKRDI